MGGGGGGRDYIVEAGGRAREGDRQTDRQIDTDRDKERHRQRGRETELGKSGQCKFKRVTKGP